MRRYKIIYMVLVGMLLLTGCGKNAIKQSAEPTSKKEVTSNYTYNNEPKYIIAKRFNNKIMFGYIDKTGKEIVKPQYYAVGQYNEGISYVQEYKDSQLFYGLIDSLGNKILESEYDKISYLSEDLLAVKSAGKTGYINKRGKFIIYPKYDYGYVFQEGLAKVIVDEKVGFINKNGDYVIYPKYDKTDNITDITGFMGGFTIVKSNGKFILINKADEIIKTLDYETITEFSRDMYKVSKNKKYGLINASGNIVLEPKYSNLRSLDKDVKLIAFSSNGNQYGVMDKTFKEILPAKYDSSIFYSENTIALYDNESKKTLLFDTKGKLLARSDYKLLGGFSNNLCLVETKDSIYQGYINKKAEVVIPLKYARAADYKDGLAFVTEAKENEVIAGYIDTKGKYIWKTNTLFTINDLVKTKTESIEVKQQTVVKKATTNTTATTTKKYSNSSYNDNYNYYDYDYNTYYKPNKSQDFIDAESDILN